MVKECFVPNGTLYLRYNYSLNKIALSRCCLLDHFVELDLSDFKKINNILDYAKKFNYSSPVFLQGAEDRCPTCNFPKDKISQVGVGLSYACNLRCYHCFYDNHHKDDVFLKDLYFEILEKIKGNYLENIQLTDRGEPFFYYYKIVQYLKSLVCGKDTLSITFLTNAFLLSKERIDELYKISQKTNIKYLFIVSVDGCTKDTYEATRIGSNFEKVIENSIYLNQFFNVIINFTIKKTNMSDVLNIKPFFKNLGFTKVDIHYDIYDDDCKDLYYQHEKLLSSLNV